MLWGGQPGRAIKISESFELPPGAECTAQNRSFERTWPLQTYQLLHNEYPTELVFRENGDLSFAYRFDNASPVVLSLPLFWTDDPPPTQPRVISAMLVADHHKEPGKDKLLSPLLPMRIHKDAAQGQATHVRLPKFKAVLALWGGAPDSVSRLTHAVVFPPGVVGEDRAAAAGIDMKWGAEPFCLIDETFYLEFDMASEGVIEFKWLLDGSPLTELFLPLEWAI